MSLRFFATGLKVNFSGFLTVVVGVELLSSSSLQPTRLDAKARAAAPLAVFVIKLRREIRCSKMSRKCVLFEVLLSYS